jgi:hypothetical protein
MSSAFLSAEPVSFEQKKQQQQQQQPPKEKNKPLSHPDVSLCIDSFNKIIENPSDKNLHLIFLDKYTTLLQKNKNDILSVFETVGNSKESNIFTFLYKNGNAQQNTWGLFEFFVTIVNICTQVAQNTDLTEDQQFILQCIMLSNDNVTPVFSYTELLHMHSEKSSDFYKDLNLHFLSSYSELTPDFELPSQKNIEKLEESLEKTDDKKVSPPIKSKKIGRIVSVSYILLVLSCLIYYFLVYKKSPVSPDILADF